MDFKDQLLQLGERISRIQHNIQTEEATKHSLIMPFIQCLGYDIFNPEEVVPEFIADIGIKKGEKVDYAILKEGQPCMLIECKQLNEKLDPHSTQLFRYFHTTNARFGVLSNGKEYKIYTDLVQPNKMDEKPFLEFDITNLEEDIFPEIRKFHRSYFNIEHIINAASELKYSNEIRAIMEKDRHNPSEAIVKYYVSQVYDGKATQKIIQQFTETIRKASMKSLTDFMNERLKTVLNNTPTQENTSASEKPENVTRIITTAEEIECFFIIKSLLRNTIDVKRIHHRDTQSYFGIILDDNNRKPLCRLYLNGNKKYIGLFDENKAERKIQLETLDDIYKLADELLSSVKLYLEDSTLVNTEKE